MPPTRILRSALGLLFFLGMPAWGQQPPTLHPGGKLPAKFDLRSIGGVTPIKQQSGGTCWAHGTMAAIESNMILSGAWKSAGLDGLPALSEYHLDWWNGFNKHVNLDVADPKKDGLTVHQGGDYRVSAAYITRGEGVVLVPRGTDKQPDLKAWFSKPPMKDGPEYRRFYVRDIEWFVVGDKLENIAAIKRRILTEGAIGTAFAVNKAFMAKDFVHYQPLSSPNKQNHAVAIVGWDDDKISSDPTKKAPRPGSWLIKNSWGVKRGDQGYYWISYYDKHCGRDPEMGAVSFRNVEPLAYQHIYYHDYHGWRDTLKNIGKAFNAYTAVDRHRLQGVSFYTAQDNVKYTVTIFSKFEDGKLSGELAVKSGVMPITGFHTINLDAPVEVKEKDRFYVCLEVSSGGQAIDRTSVIPVLLGQQKKQKSNLPLVVSKANPGESYYWDGKAWTDLQGYTFEDPSHNRTANFCMKALAVRAAVK